MEGKKKLTSFHMGTVAFSASIAYCTASRESLLCTEDTAMITLASSTAVTPRRCTRATRSTSHLARTWKKQQKITMPFGRNFILSLSLLRISPRTFGCFPAHQATTIKFCIKSLLSVEKKSRKRNPLKSSCISPPNYNLHLRLANP